MEGVILVAIVVLICAIAVPNLRSALQRDRQKRSVTAMRSLGAALESYRASTGGYPASEGGGAAALASLAPREMSAPPLQDGWHRPFSYIAVAQAGATLPTTYTLISYGKDGIYQGFQNEITRYFDCDLICCGRPVRAVVRGLLLRGQWNAGGNATRAGPGGAAHAGPGDRGAER